MSLRATKLEREVLSSLSTTLAGADICNLLNILQGLFGTPTPVSKEEEEEEEAEAETELHSDDTKVRGEMRESSEDTLGMDPPTKRPIAEPGMRAVTASAGLTKATNTFHPPK